MRKLLVLFAVVTLALCQCASHPSADNAKPVANAEKRFRATGTVEPEEVVDVSAQVAGRITNLGTDSQGMSVNFGSPVEAGAVLAQIDNALYAARVEQQRIGCTWPRPSWRRRRSTWSRRSVVANCRTQHRTGTMSESDYVQANFRQKTAKASIAVAEAVLAQDRAALQQAEIELGYTTIRSPIKGVVIDRRVNVGQMVSPIANSPSLFLVGNLEKLQVWASVNEADIAPSTRDSEFDFRSTPAPARSLRAK